jgi:hypothetical protein
MRRNRLDFSGRSVLLVCVRVLGLAMRRFTLAGFVVNILWLWEAKVHPRSC